MEISPIAGIRAMPVVKVPPLESGITRVLDIDNSSKPGDDTYSGNRKKAAGGEDDEAEDLEEGGDVEPSAQPEESSPLPEVDYFA